MHCSEGLGQMPRVDIGCMNGRFQPFHVGHLRYALAVYDRCDVMYVGIVPRDSRESIAESRCSQSLISRDPLPYHVRQELAMGSLLEVGCEGARLRVVPFPIDDPELIREYVPDEATHFVAIADKRGVEKATALRQHGHRVVTLTSWRRTTSGSEIRAAIREERDFEDSLPGFVLTFLRAKPHVADLFRLRASE